MVCMRRSFLFLALLITAPLAAFGDTTPEDVVRKASSDLLAVIEAGRTYIDEDPDRFYRTVHDTLEPVVDFPRFARGVMGAHWKRATPAQQERFVEVFKWGLLRTYAAALTEFGDGEVTVLDPQGEPKRDDRRNVQMEIRTGSGGVFPVDYTMGRGADGAWKIRNLMAGGVNIGLTYRSQFQSAVKDPKYGRDLDQVIDAWGEVLAEEAEKQQEAVAANPDDADGA